MTLRKGRPEARQVGVRACSSHYRGQHRPTSGPSNTHRVREGAAAAWEGATGLDGHGGPRYTPSSSLLTAAGRAAACSRRPRRGRGPSCPAGALPRAPAGGWSVAFPGREGAGGSGAVPRWMPGGGFHGLHTFSLTL